MSNNVKNLQTTILSKDKYELKKVTFEYLRKDGTWQSQQLEVYDKGNAATVLLYNAQTKTVLLTRQFRLPTFLNGNDSGMLIETCAGMLDNDSPEDGIKREIKEETGYQISEVQKVFEVYMSAGSITELLYFFVAEYAKEMKEGEGGGTDEQEDIEVMELPFTKAFSMIKSGEIKDAKTIMLLQYAHINKLME